jgi:hypothetical protein
LNLRPETWTNPKQLRNLNPFPQSEGKYDQEHPATTAELETIDYGVEEVINFPI